MSNENTKTVIMNSETYNRLKMDGRIDITNWSSASMGTFEGMEIKIISKAFIDLDGTVAVAPIKYLGDNI